MTRRETLKNLSLLGALAFLPKSVFAFFEDDIPLHFIGVGGAGCNMIEQLYQRGTTGKFTCITQPQRPYLPQDIRFIEFVSPGEPVYHKGELMYRNTNWEADLKIPDSVLQLFHPNEKYVLFSGLGGYTGTKLTVALSLLLKEQNIPAITVCSLPFEFEGNRRAAKAQEAIDQLKHLSSFHYFPLENIRERYGNLTINEAFVKANERTIELFDAALMGDRQCPDGYRG